MTNIHENGEKSFCRNGLKLKPFFRNRIELKPFSRNCLDYEIDSNQKG